MAMSDRTRRARAAGVMVLALAAVLAPAAGVRGDERKVTGTVEVSQVQVAFLFSGNVGGGTLHFGGKDYRFSIGGLGIGGIGASKIEAAGEVYGLERAEDFPGAYAQARYGVAAGEKSAGELFLENTNGVGLRLRARREGLALSLGGDAVYITFD